jgi:ribose transport system substrate-binding protein
VKKGIVFRISIAILSMMLLITFVACGTSGQKADQQSTQQKSDQQSTQQKSDQQSAQQEKAEGTSGEGRMFAIVYPVIHPFFDPVTVSAEAYAKENGMQVLIRAPEGGNVQQQIETVENLVAMKVDGIAIGSTDPEALAPIIDKAVDAGIPVITFDTDTPGCKRAGYIGTSNYDGGVHMANVIAKHLNKKGKILILQDVPTQGNLVDRLKAIEDTMEKEYPDIEILDVQAGYADPANSVAILESMIQANPDFDSVTGIGAAGGPAAISVWKSKGWTSEDKKIITFDNTPENIDALREGIITAIVSQRQHTWGESILKGLNTLCDGGTIPEFTDTGTIEVTLENIDTYQD